MTEPSWIWIFFYASLVPTFAQVAPIGIHRGNQVQLLATDPSFDRFFPRDSGTHVGEAFVIEQSVNVVLLCESGNLFVPMLQDPGLEPAGYASVESTRLIGENINVICSTPGHRPYSIGLPTRSPDPSLTLRMTICDQVLWRGIRPCHAERSEASGPRRRDVCRTWTNLLL